MQILVVEDEKRLAQVIRRGLLEEGYAVDLAFDGNEAWEKYEVNETYDMIILDLMLPGMDGITLLSKIRKMDSNVPVLILTAKSTTEDKVAGLDAGADDYLAKPFAFSELTARIRALLRRGNKADPPKLNGGDVELDPASHTVKRKGKEISLTNREYALLEYFMRNQNRLLSKTQILEHVWDYNYDGLSNVVETYVKYLRQKLHIDAKAQELIVTQKGAGYMFKAN